MALSGVHLFVVREVINEDTVASDMTVYNVWLRAVNGILVRAVLRYEGGCAWDAVTTSTTVIATASVSATAVKSAAITSVTSAAAITSTDSHSRDRKSVVNVSQCY